MDTGTGEGSSPKSNDLEGWRRAIASDRLRSFKLEEIASAFQDLGSNDKEVQNALAKYLSDSILHILRRRVGSNHPNRGEDIILRTHHQIIVALLRPATPDGLNLREAFIARVEFRLKDAIAVEARERRTPNEPAYSRMEDGKDAEDVSGFGTLHAEDADETQTAEAEEIVLGEPRRPSSLDHVQDTDEKIDVERILERITDDRKRLAFYLYMNDVPYHSKKKGVHSIARALNISDKTARDWVTEVRQVLENDDDIQYLKNGT